MGMEGIGARVVRKEDKRFITGKGKYTDDMVVPGMKQAHFVRSPHAHARIKSIDTSAAEKMPGVIGILNGAQLTEDAIGNIICGWMIHSKDGSPMNMGGLAAAGPGYRALCGRCRRHRGCRHQGAGARRGGSRGGRV